MQFFGIRELRKHIGDYAQEVASGSTSIISRNGKPLTVNTPFNNTLLELCVHKALAVNFNHLKKNITVNH